VTIAIMTALFLAAFLFGLGAVFEAMDCQRKSEIQRKQLNREREARRIT